MDDIWDDDAEVARPTPARGLSSRSRMLSDSEEDRPSKRARTNRPLFNPDSDDEQDQAETELPPDVGALFDGLDDDDYDLQQLPDQLDTTQLQRDSDKRVAVEAAKKRLMRGDVLDVLGERKDGVAGDKEKEKAKPRRVVPKLDEQRLLDRDGLPALVRRSKELNIKGKGHELSDLNRLMQMYQLWAHKMFPKMQFQDTVERVERLCRSKRMHVALSTWRDIDKAPGPEDVDVDAENQEDRDREEAEAQHPPTSSPARITLEPGGPSIRQSQVDKDLDEDEEEMWRDMMDAMETQNQEKEKEKQKQNAREEPEDFGGYDEEDWAIMDEMDHETNQNKPSTSATNTKSAQSGGPLSSPPGTDHEVSSDAPPELGPSEDEDDFYAMYEP